VRTRPLASLTWLLAAFLGLIPLHAAHGAVLSWSKLPQGEELVFKFDSSLPAAEPRQRGLTQIQIPVPWSFWEKERKPEIPDLSSSELLKEVSISPDGVFILTRSGDFIFSFSTDPKLKRLVIELYPPPADEPEEAPSENQTQPIIPVGNETAAPASDTPGPTALPEQAVNSTDALPQNATPPALTGQEPAEPSVKDDGPDMDQPKPLEEEPPLSGLSAVRSKIMRPGQDEDAPRTEQKPAQSALRIPIDRSATAPGQDPERLPGNQTEPEANASVFLSPPAPPLSETAETGINASPAVPEKIGEQTMVSLPAQTGERETTAHNETAPSVESAPPAEEPVGNETFSMAPSPAPPESAEAGTNQSEPELSITDPGNQTANASQAGTEDNSTAELEELYKTAQTALMAGDLKAARTAVTSMISHPKISDQLSEELLYTLADITMKESLDDLEGNFASVLEAYEAAKNSNLDSRNVPEALSRMGYLHIFVGNVPEAKGYFDLLRRKYPDDHRVAMIDYYWGEHYLRLKDYSRAAEHFQYAIQNFPMSLAVQPSTVGLLKAFTGMGYFGKALEIVDSIEKRWPRYYLSDPSFLMAAGYAAMLSENLDRAKDYFWAYANIVPSAQDVDVAMARIGDILLKQGKRDAAREIYHRTSEAHPSREGGLIAKMRLAEEGVLDQPSIADMDPVFSRPASNPEQIYNSILEHADSSLAPVARLKLAMWNLWNKKYAASLEDVRRFQDDYPGHELLPKAREVADTALRDWITSDLEIKDFDAAVLHWNAHESLYQDRELEPQMQIDGGNGLHAGWPARESAGNGPPFCFRPRTPWRIFRAGPGPDPGRAGGTPAMERHSRTVQAGCILESGSGPAAAGRLCDSPGP
jgi:tetratricopeptide (TPR) repeat protein